MEKLFYKNQNWTEFHVNTGKILTDVKIITNSVYHEYRGSIWTTYHNEHFPKLLPNGLEFKHDRFSQSYQDVLRGLHYDEKTWKLLSCPIGSLYIVLVDMREDSETYLKWESFIISPQTNIQILCPPMFANGHYVLSENSLFTYKMAYEGEYNDDSKQKTVRWDDPLLKIDWPKRRPILSKRDAEAPFIDDRIFEAYT